MDTQPKIQSEFVVTQGNVEDRASLVLCGLALSSLLLSHQLGDITPEMLLSEAQRIESQLVNGIDFLAASESIADLVGTNQAFAALFRESYRFVEVQQEP